MKCDEGHSMSLVMGRSADEALSLGSSLKHVMLRPWP
jgi:hypothetical protein